ncbi:MAG: type I DNA topoisomerase [Bacteroidales bacterium]|jgi:DNA topoisomerase-1|nr:type I DNA topoisomerase [Bacteroidales bacterium]
MIKNLVIVESPAKAKTIEGFLGQDFKVKSSFGHVRDLPPNSLGIEVEKNFTPLYEVPSDKKSLLAELKKQADQAETVWLATDEDREGEAISWHLAESLKLDEDRYKRIVFHEITKKAILAAIDTPRKIDQHLVNAQQARRVLDRLVGFELSPLLWRKVKPALSAGRVQSVAVRLIVEREKEIQAFKTNATFKVAALFDVEHKGQMIKVKADLPKRFNTRKEAMVFLEECVNATFTVKQIETKPAKKSPAAPFTTSTLQQEASRKLNFSVARTMSVAQKLYESGKITYMRTDSVNLSGTAIGMAKEVIEKNFGAEYIKVRQYATKTKGAQEAHEAIRPVYMNVMQAGADNSEQRLYELIWKRTLASQMADALLEKTNITIGISTNKENLIATGEVLKFDGFLKVYLESTDDEDEEATEGILPPMKVGQQLPLLEMNATERFTKSPPRYTEASLVKKLEELGIGRPSTYAPTISTIQKREYVVKENRDGAQRHYDYLLLKNGKITESRKTEVFGQEKNKLFPTDIGTVVNNFLLEYFQDILNYNFTANVEKEFDAVASGQKEWNHVIKDFYWPFHKQVELTLKTSEKFSGERLLGTDPKTGRKVYAKIGRFGPMIQIGDAEEEDKPLFSSMRKEQGLETITLDEALELFKLPRTVGTYEGKEMVASAGRFGPYIRHDGQFFSIPKGEDPLTIEEQRAIEVIEEKREKDRQKVIKEFPENPDVKILNGRWGAYLASGGNNYKLPKTKKPEEFSLEDCLKIIQEGTSTKKNRTTKKTTLRKKGK